MAEALLFEHEDGRYAVNPDTMGDPKWHRLGPVDVSALSTYVPSALREVHALTAENIATEVCRTVAELPDRNSPEDWPEAMLVTADELRSIVLATIATNADEDAWVIDRLSTLLAGVAIALKGEERPRHRHGYHDLPDVAQALKLELDIYRASFPNGVPESTNAGEAAPVANAAGEAFNNMFHKCRAEVSMDWWQRIWGMAVRWAWENPQSDAQPTLRSALNAMLTQFGMDEDEWNKPTFDQARRALAHPPAAVHGQSASTEAPAGWLDLQDDPRVNEIVSGLYRRFKDWSQRGFSAEDVTWCEVKADVMRLLATTPPAAIPAAPSEAFTAAYMAACKGRAPDHNEIGLHYFRAGATLAQPAPVQQEVAEKWFAVLTPSRAEGVIFKNKRDARYAATGNYGERFGVPTIADGFREAYEESDKFETIEVAALQPTQGAGGAAK